MIRVGTGTSKLTPDGRVHDDRVREAECELEAFRTLGDRPVADADDLELLGEPGVTPVTMFATRLRRETVKGAVVTLVVRAFD